MIMIINCMQQRAVSAQSGVQASIILIANGKVFSNVRLFFLSFESFFQFTGHCLHKPRGSIQFTNTEEPHMRTNHTDRIPHSIYFLHAALIWRAETEVFDFSVRTAKRSVKIFYIEKIFILLIHSQLHHLQTSTQPSFA